MLFQAILIFLPDEKNAAHLFPVIGGAVHHGQLQPY
jgi:hypothetical protein